MQVAGHLHQVLASIAVLRRLFASVPRVQRRPERSELVSGIVQVVLAMHVRALGNEQVGNGVADGDPPPTSCVERASGVGGHELEIDPLALQ